MKYFLQILLALVVCAAVITGVYYHTNDSLPWGDKMAPSTTVTKLPATEKYVSKTLIAQLKDEDFKLYKADRSYVLEHGKKSYEFENWSNLIDEETPKLYYVDIDGDKDKELIIRGVGGQDSVTGEYVYDLYILNPKTNADGYDVVLISQDTWRSVLNEYTRSEITQLRGCKKTVQFSMNFIDEEIVYNKDTGIAENGYSDYARALQDDKGKYLTVDSWIKGRGIYTLNKKNHICAEVEVIVSYKDSSKTQDIGHVYFEVTVGTDNKLSVTEKTLEFKPSEKYKTAKPLKEKLVPWTYTEKNSSAVSGSGKIDYIKYSPKYEAGTLMQLQNFAGISNDIKYVSQIDMTEKSLTLTAGGNYTFDKNVVLSPDFSVIINKGKGGEYDIAYTIALDETGKILTINFDRGFNANEIKTVEINFGA